MDQLTGWSVIASGTTADVYRAYDPQFNRQVAVKVFRQPIRAKRGDQDRFDRECQSLGQFSNFDANIVKVYGRGIDDRGRPFLIMQSFHWSLQDRLQSQGPLDSQTVTAVGVQIARALAIVHRADLKHRDVKPANVLMAEDNDYAVIGDFGIAGGAANFTATQHGSMTPLHAAPEILKAHGGGSSEADVWSLGSTLYTALLGHAPYALTDPASADDYGSLAMRVAADPLPDLPASTPLELAAALRSTMATEPTERPTAKELATALEQVQINRGWQFATTTPSTPATAPVAIDQTHTSFGARASDALHEPASPAPDPAVAPPESTPPPPPSPAMPGAFDQTNLAGDAARAQPERAYQPEQRPRAGRRWLIAAGAAVLVVLLAGSIVGAMHLGSKPGRPEPSGHPSANSSTGSASGPIDVVPPRDVRATVNGTNVAITWTGTPPDGALGVVVSNGQTTWTSQDPNSYLWAGVPAHTRACYKVGWILTMQGRVAYSTKPACINGAKPPSGP